MPMKALPYLAGFALLIALAPVRAPSQAQDAPTATALSQKQKDALQAVAARFETGAQAAALKVAVLAKDYDRVVLSDSPDPEQERKLARQFADAVTQVASDTIQSQIAAVRDMVKVLTPAQKKRLLAELERPDANPDLMELMKKVFGEQKP